MLSRKVTDCPVVHKQDMTGVGLSKVPTTLPLKWLTNKSVWVEQWPVMSGKKITGSDCSGEAKMLNTLNLLC